MGLFQRKHSVSRGRRNDMPQGSPLYSARSQSRMLFHLIYFYYIIEIQENWQNNGVNFDENFDEAIAYNKCLEYN